MGGGEVKKSHLSWRERIRNSQKRSLVINIIITTNNMYYRINSIHRIKLVYELSAEKNNCMNKVLLIQINKRLLTSPVPSCTPALFTDMENSVTLALGSLIT